MASEQQQPNASGSDALLLPSSLTLTPELMVRSLLPSLSSPTQTVPQASFKPSRVFRKHNEPGRSFTSLSFDDKGEFVISAAEDETMQLFNAKTGK